MHRFSDDLPPWWPQTFEPGCNHVTPDAPVVAHLATYTVVRCRMCAYRFMWTAVDIDPDLCDFCRKPSPTGLFSEILIWDGERRVLVTGVVCATCSDTDALYTTKET
jgi:hypothetical protein